jgi:RHS repeat-associated protein
VANITLTAAASNQLQGYGYDAAGNMTHDLTSGNYHTYDQENRITDAAGFTYTYDADGNRVEKLNGTTGTLYWYMTPGIVTESDLSGNLQSEYVFFAGDRVARKDFPSGNIEYYFSDNLKTAWVITDAAGNITSESDYYPWGGELQFANGDSNHYKFTGKERDSESGLDYFGARYYGNALGRFITPDWAARAATVPYADFVDPQSLNLYTYVRNIPTSKADADGHCSGDDQPCSANLSVREVTGIVFNETQSLHGNDVTLSDARQSIAHAIINGDNTSGGNRPATASDKVSKTNQGTQMYKDTKADVECACKEAAKGTDPTNGATYFNLRPNDSTSPFQNADQQTQSGPLDNSSPSRALPKDEPAYVDTYKGDTEARQPNKHHQRRRQRRRNRHHAKQQ